MSTEIFFAFLIATMAAVQDARQFRISNQLTYSSVVSGLIWHSFVGEGRGLVFSGSGMALGFVSLFPVFLIGGFGAGDVKLMMALGSWLGPRSLTDVLLISLIINGFFSFVLWTRQRNPGHFLALTYGRFEPVLRTLGFGGRRRGVELSPETVADEAEAVPFGVMVLIGMTIVFHFGWKVL
jgi:prepilin peptidase CpaA